MRPGISVLVAVLMLAPPLAALAGEPGRRITVNGSAEVEAIPDLARISAGVQTQNGSAAGALAENAAAMTEVFAVLEDLGIDRSDIQTSELSLDPVWEQLDDGQVGTPGIAAYQASNTVAIMVRAIPDLGRVIDALGKAGANRIFGIGFEVADPRPLLDSAREKAIDDARAKAQLMSRAAGTTLGAVISITENRGGGMPGPLRAKAEFASAPPVAQGIVSLSADVELVYALE